MVEELLVDGLWVRVGKKAAHSQLLVDEMCHGELLPHQLRRKLGGKEPTWAQQGLQGSGWRRGRGHLSRAQRPSVVYRPVR